GAMKSYGLISHMILRIPRFPVNKSQSCLQEILREPIFQMALYLASDTLYNELTRIDFQLDRCSEKIRDTLARYQKRICYRATPFGAFAGICVIPWNETSVKGIQVSADSFRTMVRKKYRLYEKSKGIGEKQLYSVSSFLYRYGSDYRIVLKGEKDEGYVFSITEIFSAEVIRQLCKGNVPLNKPAIIEILKKSGVDEKDFNRYIKELLKLQIILPQADLKAYTFPTLLDEKHMNLPGSAYDSYCKNSACGSLPGKVKQQLDQGISCLKKLNAPYLSPALTNFKERFSQQFDRKEVLLLQALDPEMGIDYASLSKDDVNEPGGKNGTSNSWTPVHKLLLGKWISHIGSAIPKIELFDDDLAALETPFTRPSPPGVAMIFSLLGNQMHIKGAGGVSGLNLIGRFTALDRDILKLAKEIAQAEKANNPDVIFAEVTHQDSAKVYSINRRVMLYDYQIPFFESREVGDDFVIGLNDLFISLVDGNLILRSARLDKVVIPRFSSAYNYQNSSLPIFRFLCDLQYEGMDANLNFSMIRLFPGLPAYPRIVYKDVILEAASWHLEGKMLAKLTRTSHSSQYEAFILLASRIGLPGEFCFEEHDHLLHIDLANEQDIVLLLKTVPKSGNIVFREYFKRQEDLVKDTAGNSYTHECIAFVVNNESSHTSSLSKVSSSGPCLKTKRRLFPFDEWLYLKMYLQPAGYKEFLLDYIYPFIKENFRQGNISSWFFISYADDDFHLRLRVKQVAGRAGRLLKTYQRWQKDLYQLPNLKRLEISTYEKESERYSQIGVECAENLFRLSSEWIINDLAHSAANSSENNYSLFSAIRHVLTVCRSVKWSYNDIGKFAMTFTNHLTKDHRVAFDMEFRQLQNSLKQFLTEHEKLSKMEDNYIGKLTEVIKPLDNSKKMYTIADLNHMHLNRHFLCDQRFQETKTYYFLGKLTRSLTNYSSLFAGQ
ncbi:MAG: thiopeptide-type bacteriocin biosynthesis protein, partial [Daejeonella sp.]